MSEYVDLYPTISVKKILLIYFDFFEFSHSKESLRHLSFETLRQLKSFSFFPKDPNKDLGQVADYLAVALESFSLILKFDQGIADRNLLNSALMLYFDFYHKDLISDFNWQDVADLTHPKSYHDAFIKYKTQLKPTFMLRLPNLYSLIETAKANGLEPYAYLKKVFTDLPNAKTIEQVEVLLPWNNKGVV